MDFPKAEGVRDRQMVVACKRLLGFASYQRHTIARLLHHITSCDSRKLNIIITKASVLTLADP